MPKVIGITGGKREGKGTCASLLTENYPGVVYEVGFADKVKIAAAKALGFDRPPRELIALMDQWKLDPTKGGAFLTATYRESEGSPTILHDLTGREYLQWFGTEVGRDLFGPDFWVDQVLPLPVATAPLHEDTLAPQINQKNLAARYPEIDVVAITDLRFENEAQRVLDLGGAVWRVNRPEVRTEDAHASEQRLPDKYVTVEIDNSGTLADLADEVYRASKESDLA